MGEGSKAVKEKCYCRKRRREGKKAHVKREKDWRRHRKKRRPHAVRDQREGGTTPGKLLWAYAKKYTYGRGLCPSVVRGGRQAPHRGDPCFISHFSRGGRRKKEELF